MSNGPAVAGDMGKAETRNQKPESIAFDLGWPGRLVWGLILFVLSLLVTLAVCWVMTGCKASELSPAALRFGVPTTVPSVTPAVRSAQASNDAAAKQAGDAYARAARLTPANLDAEQPSLLAELANLIGTIRQSAERLSAALAAATINDTAAKAATSERDEARRLAAEADQRAATAAQERDAAIRGEHKAHVMIASVVVGGILFVGVLELGAGWVIAGLAGAAGFAVTPLAIDEIRPWLKWALLAAVVVVVFLKEAKQKGSILAAVHDRFIPAATAADGGKVAA